MKRTKAKIALICAICFLLCTNCTFGAEEKIQTDPPEPLAQAEDVRTAGPEEGKKDLPENTEEDVKTSEKEDPAPKILKEEAVPKAQQELVFKGKGFTVTAVSGSGFDASCSLQVEQIGDRCKEYGGYLAGAKAVMKKEGYQKIDHLMLYDVTIIKDGKKIEPDETVTVTFRYDVPLDINMDAAEVVHFAEEKTEVIEIRDASEKMDEISFDTDSFSVYAIVEGVYYDPAIGDLNVQTPAELGDELEVYIYGQRTNTYYMMEGIVNSNQIARTPKNDFNKAVLYRFIRKANTTSEYYIQNTNDDTYVTMNGSGGMSFTAEPQTAYTVELFNNGMDGVFYIYRIGNNDNKYCLNLKGGENGKGIAGSTYKDDGSKMYLLKPAPPMDTDPYELNGKEYGLVLYKPGSNEAGSMAAAMMGQALGNARLRALQTGIVIDPTGESDKLYVAKEGTITSWQFHSKGELDYYITTEVNGARKYLRANHTSGGSLSLTLVDEPDDMCLITITSGEPNTVYEGKYRLTAKGTNYVIALRDGGNPTSGFGLLSDDGTNINAWLNLAELSSLTEEDFVNYSANKVSVSDTEKVKNGTKVVVYTRVWNEETKQYEFYAIDHDGGLIQCYEYGDTVRWKEGKINTLLWDFTEYYYEGTQEPNYYYELQNTYSGKYLAPQIHTNHILADEPIGITLNGRRYGDYYTKILAWDDPCYDYAGFVVKNGMLDTVPMSIAGEFYFAIMDDEGLQHLSTTPTVDNDLYGITMKMTKYDPTQNYPYTPGSKNKNRNHVQTDVLGNDEEAWLPLVTTDLKENGYPDALNTGQSLSSLFADGTDVNHLFIQQTYNESGYFEYNCTQNFAYLGQGNTDFTVYRQLGSFDTSGKSSHHGQFMPYDQLTEGFFSQANRNTTNIRNEELPEYDPRKGEELYSIQRENANYFFGMEMSADFMQSESGEDMFGHDLIFEFSGDDDMWLYVDGELILDLGGIHSAFSGKINYKTGEVTMDRLEYGQVTTTLRTIFESNYRQRNPNATNADVNRYMNEIFDGETFKDYSVHSMKMLYMERGAGSSNLHMRFNLTTVKDGQVLLNKKISGTDKQDYLSLLFAYKVQYKDPSDNQWKWLQQGDDAEFGKVITYYETNEPVQIAPDNMTFYIRPGETAQIHLPSDDIEYRIVECAVDQDIYTEVTANGDVLTGTTIDTDHADFATNVQKVSSRKKVVYDNKVDPSALRPLTITKKLFDENGDPLSHCDDPTTFRFRVFLGEDEDGDPEYYRLGSYHVKNENGEYCRYDPELGGFASLGKTDLSTLTEEELRSATFTTSPSGAIDKIPADHSIEIRGLLAGTKFVIEERDSEIPKGYTRNQYVRVAGSYIVEEGDPINHGTIRENTNPHMEVDNSRGWGLTAEKVWTDASFMQTHDTIYFGVYNGNTLIPNTLREYTNSTKSLYWFFDSLDAAFSQYQVMEVDVKDPQVDADGYVTSYTSARLLQEHDTIRLGGTTMGGEVKNDLSYTVTYETGEPSGINDNLRTDIVDNTASGIRIVKTDMEGNPLRGGSFELTDRSGAAVSADSYTAGRNGIITTAYLEDGEYILKENSAPTGYQKLLDEVTITISGGTAAVSDTQNCSVAQSGDTIEIRLKNRESRFKFIKTAENLTTVIPGTIFALYREVENSSGERMKDYRPMEGYDNLETDVNGVIQGITSQLSPGTYYLTEKAAAEGYIAGEDIRFTVSENAEVSIESGSAELSVIDGPVRIYEVKITNKEYNGIQIEKIDANTGEKLQYATFELYASLDFDSLSGEPLEGRNPVTSGITNQNGLFDAGKLKNGTYYLLETVEPAGYEPLDAPIRIDVGSDAVNAEGCQVTKTGNTYQITVENTSSHEYEPPVPTGVKTAVFFGMLLLAAAFLYLRRRIVKRCSRYDL